MPQQKDADHRAWEAAARRFFLIFHVFSRDDILSHIRWREGGDTMAKILKMQFTNTMGNGSTFEVSVDNPKEDIDLAMVREVAPYIGKVMGAGDATFKKAWLETVQIEALT